MKPNIELLIADSRRDQCLARIQGERVYPYEAGRKAQRKAQRKARRAQLGRVSAARVAYHLWCAAVEKRASNEIELFRAYRAASEAM